MDVNYAQAVKTFIASLITIVSLITASYLRAWETSVALYTPSPKSFRRGFKPRFVLKDLGNDGKAAGTTYINSSENHPPDGDFGNLENADGQTRSIMTNEDGENEICVKQILMFSSKAFHFPEKEYECPHLACKARYAHSDSYRRLATSHAVILHHRAKWNPEELLRSRPAGQMWIYMTKESPLHSNKKFLTGPVRVTYNWSMTYNTDSDFVIPYGRYLEDHPTVPQNDRRNWAAGKSKLIAWMASNCGVTSWGRTKFVRKLQTYIQVDTYGACGQLKCPRNSEDCDRILSAHKFYLALENSECDDYITEKFWKNGLSKDMVPIVYGTTRDRYERVAPPHSFIHVSDFKNMTHLVDYIKYLDSNDTAYNEYFEWKKRGSVECYRSTEAASAEGLFCEIVKKLRAIDERISMKIPIKSDYLDLQKWSQQQCKHRLSIWSS